MPPSARSCTFRLILNDNVPEEHKDGIDMGRDMLKRSRMLLVCGGTVDEDVKNDIAVAARYGIAATTLGRHYDREGAGFPGQCRILSWGASLTG